MAFSLSQTDVAAHPSSRFDTVGTALEPWLEAERERIGLWVPVLLGVGICAWFALPAAPGWIGWVLVCCATALAALGLPAGSRLRMVVAGGALVAAMGCILVWGKALALGEPPLARPVFAEITGTVIAAEKQPAEHRWRLVVKPERPEGLPLRIRVNVDADDLPHDAGPGARLSFRARLMPPPPPAVPGAYDFASRAYFMGIGATGRALPPVRVEVPGVDVASGLRQRVADHISNRLDATAAGIAIALANGDQGSITQEDADAMRRSGLAHLLSISGIHVSALIGAVILIVHRLLALSRRFALRLPLMLIAAGSGAVAGIAYTLFTGAQVPTVRSCIAALLVLAALALGREAISLRLVAFGALVVLLFWPEAVTGPSFQMSFAAVTVIVALAESHWFRALTHARDEAVVWKAARALLGLFIVGVAVEIALMPIALFHFHQAGVLGAFANLVAIPLTTFVIMPGEAAALALDLVGLGAPLWWVTGQALHVLLALAHAVSAQPIATWALPYFPAEALALVVLGGLWLVVWRTNARLLGLPLMAAGGVMMALATAPDVMVTGDGRHMAVRQADGSLALLRGRAGDYVRQMVSASAGDGAGGGEGLSALAQARNARCSRELCFVLVQGQDRDWLILATLSHVRVPWGALVDACARADIVVSDRRLPAGCVPRWLKLDRAQLRRTGGVAVYLDDHDWTGVLSPGDRHPWVAQEPPTR